MVIDPLTIYWYILIGSLVLAILFFLFGDLISHLAIDFLHPLLLLGSLAVLSGSAIILTDYSHLTQIQIFIISLFFAIIAYVLIYNFLIIPISHAEASSAHSAESYYGRIGEVITTIPKDGYGEILIESVSGSTNETARSFDDQRIPQGTKIVVIQVDQDCVYVSPLEDDLKGDYNIE